MTLLAIIYLIGSITFILGLKMLSHPDTAKRGNLIAAAGMTIAIFGTIFLYEEDGVKLQNYGWIFGALILGTVVGTIAARRVKMTAMPEMVSLFNGMGGACAMLISVLEFKHLVDHAPVTESGFYSLTADVSHLHVLIIIAGLVIGSISFSGSMVAWGKLNGSVKDFVYKGQQYINLLLLGLLVVGSAYFIATTPTTDVASGATGISSVHVYFFYAIAALSLLYGVMFVFPIGGADMPVVISLLNSFTGVAAACGGFLYNNQVMLTGGILVGAAGTLLTILMCKAMNRSLLNVLLGAFGGNTAASGATASVGGGTTKEITLNDTAVVMAYASKVMIVPGYGLAVAQAQHVCHELEKMLEERGVEVKYAIHPVAGRMPGHMNVLLAEADVSYEKLLEMEQANDEFTSTDVVLILGANDVVNPAAKTDPASPIYGMPILEVEQSKHVIVNKRSMKPGYAGIENMLFFQPKTSMLFGDAKAVLQKLVAELKEM
ncbi:NAD(P)(+) transhydrogenase (Re/Si-specific) subunit beta [Aridibaculum aurantiacum]|uniref:NAD(P)(+) transhydrogenase (Re/Si-specific) subunit beta n=1 Tax=Aridibaculum aurantiacum TaxID=2810307 RepID=UPI001A971F9F|nr:NAD(P)(+) transhydrogenase (Re/Si-specific) subunit beta [Aridibaculum aurantiacum]